MSTAGAPKRNGNAHKGAQWKQALKRALTRVAADNGDKKPNYRRGMDLVANTVVRDAIGGNPTAWQEIGVRIDGKPGQAIELSGPDGGPIPTVEWSILPVVPIDEANAKDK